MLESNPLNYDATPRKPRWRRWAVGAAGLALIGCAIFWHKPVLLKAQTLYWQRQCMNFSLPPGTGISATQPSKSFPSEFPGNWPGEYGAWPHCMSKLDSVSSIWDGRINAGRQSTVFLHERVSPAGHRRLVLITVDSHPNSHCIIEELAERVFEFETLSTYKRDVTRAEGCAFSGPYERADLYFGQVDPNDESHFTIDYLAGNYPGTIDCWLKDDDSLLLQVRTPNPLQRAYDDRKREADRRAHVDAQ